MGPLVVAAPLEMKQVVPNAVELHAPCGPAVDVEAVALEHAHGGAILGPRDGFEAPEAKRSKRLRDDQLHAARSVTFARAVFGDAIAQRRLVEVAPCDSSKVDPPDDRAAD